MGSDYLFQVHLVLHLVLKKLLLLFAELMLLLEVLVFWHFWCCWRCWWGRSRLLLGCLLNGHQLWVVTIDTCNFNILVLSFNYFLI